MELEITEREEIYLSLLIIEKKDEYEKKIATIRKKLDECPDWEKMRKLQSEEIRCEIYIENIDSIYKKMKGF